MGDIMRPVPVRELMIRIAGEYQATGRIFGIPKELFFHKKSSKKTRFFGDPCDMPVGPAAGPHTQLAQNIIAAYLTGARFFELKTIQVMDELEIEKPCIDPRDECYNTEWSSEYTVSGAFREYLKAWLVIPVLDRMLGLSSEGRKPRFLFNMSAGYDLEGIKSEKVDSFIDFMKNGYSSPWFDELRDEVRKVLRTPAFSDCKVWAENGEASADVLDTVSPEIGTSFTLSTMHGCPPDEIEAICNHMIREKGLDMMVKLNPTLLGFDTARQTLDRYGFDYLTLKRETFEHDLQYGDALAMLERMQKVADDYGKHFGIKLSNTLASVNDQGQLPGEEMYMSGRALFPLTLTLASRISGELNGMIPISFSAGVTGFNAVNLFRCGIKPLSMATELLKPGGYYRLKGIADQFENMEKWSIPDTIDTEALSELLNNTASSPYIRKSWRGKERAAVAGTLPLFDCAVAPCVEACPVHQQVPDYIRLTGDGKYDDALERIYRDNALPGVTGAICEHKCMYSCTRLDYEGAVEIRDMKAYAVERGEYRPAASDTGKGNKVKVAVVGAGPAGLSAAYFLAKTGTEVTVFEKEAGPGGVVGYVLPEFRLDETILQRDVETIRKLGAQFNFGYSREKTASEIKKGTYTHICLAIGAEKSNNLALEGEGTVIKSLDLLRTFRESGNYEGIGRKVVVVGGGNTAMDSARAAIRIPGVEEVSVCYRRSEEEMPADREEYENAVSDGVVFRFLLQPESFHQDEVSGNVVCNVMKLGIPDESGRRRPEATGETVTIPADSVISAIGEGPDKEVLSAWGIGTDKSGGIAVDPDTLETEVKGTYLLGDARTGPSSVVECIAEGRRCASAILAGQEIDLDRELSPDGKAGKGSPEAGLKKEAEVALRKILHTAGNGFQADAEAERCLECSTLCNKCVEVCPNRANMALPVPESVDAENLFQIIHIDAYCNECGTCATFCPWDGKPYTDKLTIFSFFEDFDQSENPGFVVEDGVVTLRLGDATDSFPLDTIPWDDDRQRENVLRIIENIRDVHPWLLGPVDK